MRIGSNSNSSSSSHRVTRSCSRYCMKRTINDHIFLFNKHEQSHMWPYIVWCLRWPHIHCRRHRSSLLIVCICVACHCNDALPQQRRIQKWKFMRWKEICSGIRCDVWPTAGLKGHRVNQCNVECDRRCCWSETCISCLWRHIDWLTGCTTFNATTTKFMPEHIVSENFN